MKKISFIMSLFAVAALLPLQTQAQITTPAASPSAKFSTTVGLTEVEIQYSRPSKKGRTIFAKDGLVPFGETWRTGANKNTMITVSDDVKIGGVDVKKGSYAIFTIPNEKEWTILLYTDTENWGVPKDWDSNKEAARFTVKAQTMNHEVETFLINIGDQTYKSASLELIWDRTLVEIPLVTDPDAKVSKEFNRLVQGPNTTDYYNMAAYMHESGQDLSKALEYVEKATKDDPKFWQVRRKSLILADMGKYKEAVEAAKQSLELAQKAGNSDYVRMNEKSIAEWTKKK